MSLITFGYLISGLVLLVVGAVLSASRVRLSLPRTVGGWLAALRTPTAVVVFVSISGLLLALYAIRVGGDFMHGRTLLPALFTPSVSNIMTLLFVPVIFIWGVLFLWIQKWAHLKTTVFSLLLGFGLASFFLLPALFLQQQRLAFFLQ